MKENCVEELMKVIHCIDPDANIQIGSTDKFYVSANIEIREGDVFRSPLEHRDTIKEAVTSYYKRIQGQTLLYNDQEKHVPTLFDKDITYKGVLLEKLFLLGMDYSLADILLSRLMIVSNCSDSILYPIKQLWNDVFPDNSTAFYMEPIRLLDEAVTLYAKYASLTPIGNKDNEVLEIITICSSTRFKKEIELVTETLELQNKIVLPVVCISNPETLSDLQLEMLNDIHRKKIDMSSGIFVIDVNGYIGDNVRSEIEYAESKGKKVTYLSDVFKNAFALLK